MGLQAPVQSLRSCRHLVRCQLHMRKCHTRSKPAALRSPLRGKIPRTSPLPLPMIALQPMLGLGRLALGDRLQRIEVDRLVGPPASRRARARRSVAGRPRSRRARGRAELPPRQGASSPCRGTAARNASASSRPWPRSSASAAVSAASSYSSPTQSADCATIMSGRPASAPRISRKRLSRTSVKTVVMWSAKSPTVARSRPGRQPPRHEVAERGAGNIDVAAIAVDEIHRHVVDQPFDIALEAEAGLEHDRGNAGPVVVGVGPDMRAVGQEAVRPALGEGRVGEQRGGQRLQQPARRAACAPCPARRRSRG